MMKVGRIIGTALLGFFFMLFIALDLVLFGVVALASVVVTLLPLIGLVLGAAIGAMVNKNQQPAA
jgi:hypothetical protein